MKKLKLVILVICVAFFGGVPIVSADFEEVKKYGDYETPIKAYLKEKIKLGWNSAKINTDQETVTLLTKLKSAYAAYYQRSLSSAGTPGGGTPPAEIKKIAHVQVNALSWTKKKK
eukprot:498002_1